MSIRILASAAFDFAANEFRDLKLLREEREETDEIALRRVFPGDELLRRAAIFRLVLEDRRVGRFLELIESLRADVRTLLLDVAGVDFGRCLAGGRPAGRGEADLPLFPPPAANAVIGMVGISMVIPTATVRIR